METAHIPGSEVLILFQKTNRLSSKRLVQYSKKLNHIIHHVSELRKVILTITSGVPEKASDKI